MSDQVRESSTNWVGLLIGWFLLLIVTGIAIGPYAPIEDGALAVASGVIAGLPIATLWVEGWL